jgi:hypothetical protein
MMQCTLVIGKSVLFGRCGLARDETSGHPVRRSLRIARTKTITAAKSNVLARRESADPDRGNITVWDSLAICEFWPSAIRSGSYGRLIAARARARDQRRNARGFAAAQQLGDERAAHLSGHRRDPK